MQNLLKIRNNIRKLGFVTLEIVFIGSIVLIATFGVYVGLSKGTNDTASTAVNRMNDDVASGQLSSLGVSVDRTNYPISDSASSGNVTDTIPPTILGVRDFVTSIGKIPDYKSNVTATDNIDGIVAVSIDDTSLRINLAGQYNIKYTAVDKSGNSTTVYATITVKDSDSPEILGVEPIIVEYGYTINYLYGISVIDNTDTNLKVSVDSSAVNTDELGTYTIIYRVTDSSGNRAEESTTVTIQDNTPPVLYGIEDKTSEKGIIPNYLSGISAYDNKDGDVTGRITVNSSLVNVNKSGVYPVTYCVTDTSAVNSNNPAGPNQTCKTSKITIVDGTPPVISNVKDKTIEYRKSNTDESITTQLRDGVKVTDDSDNNISVRVDISAVNYMVLGTYQVKYTAIDSSGNVATAFCNVTIVDTTPPVIYGIKPISAQLGVHPNYLAGLSAIDEYDGAVAVTYDTSKVNIKKRGTYTVTYSAEDSHGNISTATTTVAVDDRTAPVITGVKNIQVEYGSKPNYLDGVKAVDDNDGEVEVKVDDSKVNLKALGTYEIVYSATDSSKNTATVKATVTVQDTTKPVIKGVKDISVKVGQKVDLMDGISATDNYDGPVPVTLRADNVNFNKVGNYVIQYIANDSFGNIATETANVLVKDDTKPVIKGVKDLIYEFGDPEPKWLNGISAHDDSDGDITYKLTYDISGIDFSKLGAYEFSYSVTDFSGNTATEYARFTIVDNTGPMILGAKDLVVIGSSKPTPINYLEGVTAYDKYDGDLTSQIVVNSSNVNQTKAGVYSASYSVSDSQGNTSVKTIFVTVKDSKAPEIVAIDIIHEYGDAQPNLLKGVTAYDENDGDITSKLTVSGQNSINWTKLGIYKIVYSVTDSSGNTKTKNVNVIVQDTKCPVISGVKKLTAAKGTKTVNYLSGVTANDVRDGNLTSSIKVDSSKVNLNVSGTYKVVYSVADSLGNSCPVETTIDVIDSNAPVCSLSTSKITHEFTKNPAAYNWNSYISCKTSSGAAIANSNIKIDSSSVNLNKLGTYSVYYYATNAGINSITHELSVVVRDTTAPTISGTKNWKIYAGTSVDFVSGVTATDIHDGDLTNKITIDSSSVDYNKKGTYTVIYSVTDSSGNKATKNITVEVLNNNSYRLTYNANGGSVTPAYKDLKLNDAYGALPTPSRSGYTFNGWYTAAAGGSKVSTTTKMNSTSGATIYAQWTAIKYTVSFNLAGFGYKDISVTYGLKYSNLPVPVKEGYTFSGWYLNANYTGTAITTNTNVSTAKNHTLYGRFTANSYTIRFNGNGSTSGTMTDVVCYFDNECVLPSNVFAKTGYTFKDWSSPSKTYQNGATLFNETTTNKDIILLSANWVPNSYKVNFNINSGTSGVMTQISCVYDSYCTLPDNKFAKTGYSFAGWATSASGTVLYENKTNVKNLTSTKDGTVTLYAKWTQNSYKVCFLKNDSEATGTMDCLTANYDNTYTLTANAFFKEGYTFMGWSKTASGKVDYQNKATIRNLASIPNETIYLYAVWAIQPHSLEIQPNGGTFRNSTAVTTLIGNYKESVKIENPTAPAGYTVTYNANGGTASSSSAKTTKTFSRWTHSGGGTFSSGTYVYGVADASLKAVYVDNEITLPTATRTGYSLSGWYTAATGGTKVGVASGTYSTSKNITLYAQWEPVPYTVTMVPCENGTSTIKTKQVAYNSAYGDLGTVNKTGYHFTGWNKDESLLIPITNTTIMNESKNHNVYGACEANNYTIVYDGNGSDSGTMEPTACKYDEDCYLTRSEFYKQGSSFLGWSTSKTAATPLYTDEQIVKNVSATNNGTVTLYAVWTNINYKICYNSNASDATGSMSCSKTLAYSEEYKLPKNTYVKKGYNFRGWSTNPADSNIAFENESTVVGLSYTNNATVTLYAVWSLDLPTLTIDAGLGAYNEVSGKTNVEYATGTVLPILDASGYNSYEVTFNSNTNDLDDNLILTVTNSFTGWVKTGSGTYNSSNQTYTFGTGNGVLTAQYTQDKFVLPEVHYQGHLFLGWYNESGTRVGGAGDTYKPTKNTVLTAKWQTIIYTISYNANGGSGAPASQTKTYGEELTLSDVVPVRTGYTFVGWEATIENMEETSGNTVTYQPGEIYRLNHNAAFKAVWEIKTYTIIFNGNGANEDSVPEDIVKSYFTTVKIPNMIPVLEGRVFEGWGLDSETGVVSYRPGDNFNLNQDTTLHAIWHEENFTVTFKANGGKESSMPPTAKKMYFSNLTLPTTIPQRDGHIFKGYATSATGTVVYQPGDIYSENKSVDLYAIWQIITYKVTFNANGGTGAPAAQTKTWGVDLKLSSQIPTKTGKVFAGWGLTSTATGSAYLQGQTYKDNKDITLYAIWTIQTYEIVYNANGGDASSIPQKQIKSYDETLVLSSIVPKRVGYTFNGWSTSASATTGPYKAGSSYTVNASATLFAIWKINSYSLTINPNGEKWNGVSTVSTITRNYATTYTVPNPVVTNFTVKFNTAGGLAASDISTSRAFYGWTHSGGGSYNSDSKIYTYGTSNGTLTANYTAKTIALPTTSKTGYTFNGWYTAATGGTKIGMAGTGYTPGASTTLYAQWIPLQYIVTFDANGGTGAPAAQAKVNGTNLTLSSTVPTRTGYTFKGWSLSSTGSVNYTAGGTYTREGNTTLYAVWQINSYTLSINPNGGTYNNVSTVSTVTQNYNTELALAKPVRIGYTFKDWTLSGGGSLRTNNSSIIYVFGLSNGTLTAQWEVTKNTLTINANGGTYNGLSGTTTYSQDYDTTKLLSIPTKTGYTFNGWTKNGTGTLNTYGKALNTDVSFAKGSNSVTVYNNAGNGYVTHTRQSSSSDNPTGSGYELKIVNNGGASSPGKGGFIQGTNSKANGVYYHAFTAKIPVGYTVNDARNSIGTGGSSTWLTSRAGTGKYETYIYRVNAGASGTFSSFGHVYLTGPAGTVTWYLASSTMFDATNGTDVKNSASIYTFGAGNETIIAGYNANLYTVKYNGNGATSGSTASSSHSYDISKALTTNAFVRTGYIFKGWATSAGGSVSYTNGQSVKNLSTVDGGVVNLYAVWVEQTYTVSYNANGGTGAPASQTKRHSVALTLSTTKPTRTGYTFKGWGTSASTTTVSYVAGGQYTSEASITLYAIWQQNTFNVKYNANVPDVSENLKIADFTRTQFGSNFTNFETVEDSATKETAEKFNYNGTAGWEQLMYPVDTVKGQSYTFSFKLKSNGSLKVAENNKQTDVNFYAKAMTGYEGDANNTSTKVISKTSVIAKLGSALPTNYTAYSLTFTGTGDKVYLNFNFGYFGDGVSDVVYFKDMKVESTAIPSNIPSTQIKTYGVNLTLSSLVPTLYKHEFKGWATSASGEVVYKPGDSYSSNANLNLYAVWQKKLISVNYNVGNLVYGLQELSVQDGTRAKITTNGFNSVVVPKMASDSYDYSAGRVYLMAGQKYRFTVDTNGTKYGTAGDAQVFLVLNGNISSTYLYMDSADYEFTAQRTGTYYIRLDANSSKTVTYSNIVVTPILTSSNLVTGLSGSSTQSDGYATVVTNNNVSVVTPKRDTDSYTLSPGRVSLTAGKTYKFSVDMNGSSYGSHDPNNAYVPLGDGEIFLALNGSYSTVIHMEGENYTFIPTTSGTYHIRMDANNSKPVTFSNITIVDVNQNYQVPEATVARNGDTYDALNTSQNVNAIWYNFGGWCTDMMCEHIINSNDIVSSDSETLNLYAKWDKGGDIEVLSYEKGDNGFDVKYLVSSPSQYNFAVWTSNNGQDDLLWTLQSSTANGMENIITLTIPFSSHKNEKVGPYNIHVYVPSGPCALTHIVNFDTPIVRNPVIESIDSTGYTVGVDVYDDEWISLIQFPTWTLFQSQDDLNWNNINVKIVGEKHFSWRFENQINSWRTGEFRTHIYVHDRYGNQGSIAAPDTTIPTGIPNAKGEYLIRPVGSMGYRLDVSGASPDSPNGTNIRIWQWAGEMHNFKLIDEGSGTYSIQFIPAGKCLDIANGNLASLTNVQLHDCNHSNAQKWKLVDTGQKNGAFFIRAAANTNLSLDIENGNFQSGTNVRLHTSNTSVAQQWVFGDQTASTYVSYDLKGGNEYFKTQNLANGYTIPIPNTIPTKKGYKFKGWTTSSTGTTVQYNPGDKISYTGSNIKLYAIWENGTYYTINYNMNGGSGAIATDYVSIGESFKISSTLPTRTGYTFVGWGLSASDTYATYRPSQIVEFKENTTLYAIWR